MSSGQPGVTAGRRRSLARDVEPERRPRTAPARTWLALACCILALGLPARVEAWSREAPVLGIQYRVPPEVEKKKSYFKTDLICKNVTSAGPNVTKNGTNATHNWTYNETTSFWKNICRNVTKTVHPWEQKQTWRKPTQFSASEFDSVDDNGTFSPWISLGCWQNPYGMHLDKLPGAIRANVTCKNVTAELPIVGDENNSYNKSYLACEGGLSPDNDETPFTGLTWDPVNCTTACQIRRFSIAAMSGIECWCLKNKTSLVQRANVQNARSRCWTPCAYSYFNGTSKFCGGPNNQYSIYQIYDQIHQTGQGTLDPFRKIWYMVVSIEKVLNTQYSGGKWVAWKDDYGNWTKAYTWYLHTSSTQNGEPMFPYNYELDGPFYGLQYDLDNSSIYGFELPYWDKMIHELQDEKRKNADWIPWLCRYEMHSGNPANIYWKPKDIIGKLPLERANRQMIYAQTVSTLDSINDMYFLAVPYIAFPFKVFTKYYTTVYGFDTGVGAALGLKAQMLFAQYTQQEDRYHVVDLQADSRDHSLYGLITIKGDQWRENGIYYVRLGYSYMTVTWPTNPFDPIITQVDFRWTFKGNNFSQVKKWIVNDPLYNSMSNISEKFYQVGSGTIDPETNSSFVLYKDRPDTASPFLTKNVKYKHSNFSFNPQTAEPFKTSIAPSPVYGEDWVVIYEEKMNERTGYFDNMMAYYPPNTVAGPAGKKLAKGGTGDSTGISASWIANPDPIYPWFRPRLETIRFNLNGDTLFVKFENFTNGGIQPIDSNGDTLPDAVEDWGEAQVGHRNCTDMFGPNVSQYFLDMPFATCEWYYNDTIHIYLTEVETVFLGDPIDFKNWTIYGYIRELETWTFSAYGIYPTLLPKPLYAPVVELFSIINGVANVDFTIIPEDEVAMCKYSDVDALYSYWHGGTPYYSWYVRKVYCEYFDSYGFTDRFFPNTTLLMRFVTELMNKSIGADWTYKSRGLKRISFPPHSLLEPGCQYTMELYLFGRWGLGTTVPYLLKKRGPPGVAGWTPDCDYHCNEATCEPPSQCLGGITPGPLIGPMILGERVCICDENRYGLFCDGICPMCSPYRTFGCDDGRMGGGVCICKIGFDGDYCDQKLEYWATEWSPCLPCGATVGTQFRVMKCTNIVTLKTVNNTRCPGGAPLTEKNCKPPLCPCTSPPEIPGGDNVTIKANCPEVMSGATCKPICQDGSIAVGEFRCFAGSFIELAECVKSGLPMLTVPAISINFRLNAIEWNGTADTYLEFIEPTLKLTIADFLSPVNVANPSEDIKFRIRSIPASGNRSLAGRRLAGERPKFFAGNTEATGNNGTASSNRSRWRQWAEVYFRDKANNGTNTSLENASADTSFKQHAGQPATINFNQHRAAAVELLGLPHLTLEGTSVDRASASIASRLMGQRGLGNASTKKERILSQESAPSRRLALSNFEISVSISLSSAVEQQAAKGKMSTLKSNPAPFGKKFAEVFKRTVGKEFAGKVGKDGKIIPGSVPDSIPGMPSSWEASSPSLTQVYTLASKSQRLNTTTSTQPPPPPPVQPPPPNQASFQWGIIIGITLGLFLVTAPLGVLGVWLWRKKVRRAKAIAENDMVPLPPAPARQWEAKWEMPDSAKIMNSDGTPMTGPTKREWQGGGTYEGQVNQGIREGEGRMQWPNGKSYSGEWVFGRPQGHGVLHAPGERGWTYNGQFKDGQRHGIGRCESLARRIWYDGEWLQGVQHGMGENGNLPTLPAGPRSNVPPPVAHIWRMENGEQQDHLSISKVAPERQNLIGLALEASTEDAMRLNPDYMPGGSMGPPTSHLQLYSRLWGICFGRPDDWLPSCWGALVITRIMDGGALARWNMWHSRDMGDNARPIRPNALIWRVNGVEGDIDLMSQELCAEDGRRRLQLAITNPATYAFTTKDGFIKRAGPGIPKVGAPAPQPSATPSGMLALPPLPQLPQTLWFKRPSTAEREAGPPQPPQPPSPQRGRRGRSPQATAAIGDLRRAALEDAAHIAQVASLGDVPRLAPSPPHAPPPGGVRPQQNLPALPMLPSVPHSQRPPSMAPLPALPDIPQHLSTLALAPPPPMLGKAGHKPPPGRPLTPGEMPAARAGPPPKAPRQPRVGYRAIAAATRAAREQGLPDPRMQPPSPDPPG